MAKNNSNKQASDLHIVNKKARFNYEIIEDMEAGIVLQGSEIKSIRAGKINITDAYAILKKGEIFIINLKIDIYENSSFFNHEPTRQRKLLLHRKEINKLTSKMKERGFSLIPLKIYLKNNYVKVLLGLGKGKKEYDKRHTIKDRQAQIEMKRDIKAYL